MGRRIKETYYNHVTWGYDMKQAVNKLVRNKYLYVSNYCEIIGRNAHIAFDLVATTRHPPLLTVESWTRLWVDG